MPTLPMLAGPTASGKSAAALTLAQRYGLHIVSADSMQVYTGMDVGTAKPAGYEREMVPHHLIDVVTPGEQFSVADYVRLAEDAIDQALEQGASVLVTGGTGFYLRALREGLPTLPPASPEAQAPLWLAVEEGRFEELLEELAEAAPADAARAGRNPRRVVRSLEVLRATGRPPSAYPNEAPRHRYDLLVLDPPADALAERIEARARKMFERGLVEEVRELLALYPEQPTALQAIGYKEVADHLFGEVSESEALAAVVLATRQYAKRQRTWFRREKDATFVPAFGDAAMAELDAWVRGVLGR